MSSKKFRSEVIKLIIFFIVAITITVSVIATLLDLKIGQANTGYHAIFTNASGLSPGDTVRIAGVEVGKVNGVSLSGVQAKVDFSVYSSEHLTTTSTASIQFENLLGQRYLQVSAGPPGGQPLHGNATIPVTRTTPGLDLTAVFSGFQPLLAALNPKQVNELTGSIIAVLQGESGAVANLVTQTASFTSNLAQHQDLINQILDNLTPLLTDVNKHDAQLGQLIYGLDKLVTGLAGQRQQIGNAVTGLSNLTTNTSNLLNRVQPLLDQNISGLLNATGVLVNKQQQLTAAGSALNSVLNDLPAVLNSLAKVSDSGNYLAVYVCDLTIHISGPISVKLSPTVPQSPPLSVPTGFIGSPTQHTPVCQ